MNAIDVRDLSKEVDDFRLKSVTFTVKKGTVAGLVGKNGAGKTTLIECILNLRKVKEGSIHLYGLTYAENVLDIKAQIGVVYDDLHMPEHLTANDCHVFYKEVFTTWDEAFYFNFLKRYSVDPKKKISKLSRGTKMKLALALALSHHPKLLILDEPTSGLDPVARDEILGELAKYMEDDTNSILISSHITSDLEKIADTITLIEDGAIIFSEDKDVLTSKFGLWSGTALQAESIPPHAITWQRSSAFGVTLLVEREFVSEVFALETPSIEDLILFHTKGT